MATPAADNEGLEILHISYGKNLDQLLATIVTKYRLLLAPNSGERVEMQQLESKREQMRSDCVDLKQLLESGVGTLLVWLNLEINEQLRDEFKNLQPRNALNGNRYEILEQEL